MNILLILIPISLIFMLIAIAFFIWAISTNQFENLESAALDILVSETKLDDTSDNTGAD